MKSIFILFALVIAVACKSTSNITGVYEARLSDSTTYTFNLSSKQFTHKLLDGSISDGRFNIIHYHSKNFQLVCNEIVLKKTSSFIKETNAHGDSIVIGVNDGYQRLGQTVFEITIKKRTLLFRKTYSNQTHIIESEGILIRK